MAFDVLLCPNYRWPDSWSFRIRFAFREHQLGRLRLLRLQRPVDFELACRRTGRGGSGYPVASASLSRSRSGVGGPAGAPNALNELDPLPQTCYASGVDATGYPRPGDPPPRARSGPIPEPRPTGGTCV
jgi:hypothetical protein